MTASDKKKAQLLVGLLVIAGLTWFFVYRSASVATTDAKKKRTKATAARQIKDPKIRIELIASAEGTEDVGRKNIFQYRQKPLPPAPILPPRPIVQPPLPGQNAVVFPPPTPVAQPFKPFKYEGLSIVGHPKTGQMLAVLSEGTNTYQVKLGECLMGQYCVRQLTENSIEIEDLQLKQRRSFTRIPPQ